MHVLFYDELLCCGISYSKLRDDTINDILIFSQFICEILTLIVFKNKIESCNVKKRKTLHIIII